MSININNLVSKPVDTVHMVHRGAKIRDVLRKLINKQDTTVIIVEGNEKMPGGFANHKKQKNHATRKGERRATSFSRRRRARLKTLL